MPAIPGAATGNTDRIYQVLNRSFGRATSLKARAPFRVCSGLGERVEGCQLNAVLTKSYLNRRSLGLHKKSYGRGVVRAGKCFLVMVTIQINYIFT